jgi:hypothetical protein
MAKRDPNITAKNAWIKELRSKLDDLLPRVLAETGIESLLSINAIIGSKHDKYFNLRDDVFTSPDNFLVSWYSELDRLTADGHPSSAKISYYRASSPAFSEYLQIFLKRSFLLHFHEWSRVRPTVENATMWIGQNNADYGLLVTPRFAGRQWENDKSEIRTVSFNYWTIGHVLASGIVVPSNPAGVFKFEKPEDYLNFFENVIVRNSGSKYEKEIAKYYTEFVLSHPRPLNVPLLIPEFRYEGLERKHVYRLDFTVINPYTQQKVGIELSPWSSHGYISRTKQMTQAEINEAAQNNFEKEMQKHRRYFRKFGIFVLIYTDSNLANCKALFDEEIAPLLSPEIPKPVFPFEMARRYGLT